MFWGRRAALGCGMMVALCLGAQAQEANNCPPLRAIAALDMTVTRGGGIYIPVEISGQPRLMTLDTGGAITSITPEATQFFNLQQTHARLGIVDVLGNTSNTLAVIPEFKLGRLRTKDLKVFILPGKIGINTVGRNDKNTWIGIFGADFLRVYDVDLDFSNKKMRLVSPEHCTGQVVYWNPAVFSQIPMTISDNGHIIIPVTLDGVEAKAMIDTGASHSIIHEKFFTHNFTNNANEATLKGKINNEDVEGMSDHHFKRLTMNGLSIDNPVLTVLPDVAGDKRTMSEQEYADINSAKNPALILGARILSRLHIYIAYKEKRLYISAANDPAPTVTEQKKP